MHIVVAGIPIEVEKKNNKHMYLYVKPPDGHVVISAPADMDDKAIEIYARTNLSRIKKYIQDYQNQPRSSKRQYVSGETMYVWGKQYFIKFVPSSKKNSLSFEGDQAILSMSNDSTVKQRESFVREEYRVMLVREIERLLPKWESITGLHCDGWQTKYMVTKWGACNREKKKLWFNLQLAQKPIECLNYIILHELIHFHTPKHDATFTAYMDLYMPNWRDIRNELNSRKLDYYEAQDESPLKKLIDSKQYDEIHKAVVDFITKDADFDTKKYNVSLSDTEIEIENVIRIEQAREGVISFDVIISCDLESKAHKKNGQPYFTEKWFTVHCEVSIGIELTDFTIASVRKCETQDESENDRYSGELVPIISRDDFDKEATAFLKKYYPIALEQPSPVPIRQIAESMGLTVVEDARLSEDLSVFGMIVFEDGNITGANKRILIRNAKRGTMYIDPHVYYENNYGSVNFTVAHECYHWYRHQPYHALMKMIGAKDGLGKIIKCAIQTNNKDNEKWKAVDWLEWQANSVALHILMPYQTTKNKIDELMGEYVDSVSESDKTCGLEIVVDKVADYYGVSRQAAKNRMLQLGYTVVDGVYAYVDGRYIPPFSFDIESIGKNQTYTISATDLFKAYCSDKKFRNIIDSGKAVYVDGHLCLNSPEYIELDEQNIAHMTPYALAHVDECCYIFSMGYVYDSVYQNQHAQYLTRKVTYFTPQECSFDANNPHNVALNAMMDVAVKESNDLRRYPGSFAETLSQMMTNHKISVDKLADLSLVGSKTIQRLRNDEEYKTTKQTVLGLCVGMKLTPPEADVLLEKSDFKLNTTKTEDFIYKCVLASCRNNSIYAINEMLVKHGVPPLGSDEQS